MAAVDLAFGVAALSAACLVAGAGLAKLYAPAVAAAMITSLKLPGLPSVAANAVRAFGLLEVALAIWVISLGDRASLLALAACYLIFTAVVARAMTRDSTASCGCFGADDVPLSPAHLAVDALLTAAAGAAALHPAGAVGGITDLSGAHAVIATGQAMALTVLLYAALTALPPLLREGRRA